MPKSSPRLKLKTVILSHSVAILPLPKRSVTVENVYRTVDRDLKEILAEFKKVMYPPDEPYYGLTTEDQNKIMKAALHSRYYSKSVKSVIAETFNDNVVAMKWTYEFADTETLYWNIAYYWEPAQHKLNDELISLAVKNRNFDRRCMQAIFSSDPKCAKKLLFELKDEAFTNECLLWLLPQAEKWGIEAEACLRVSQTLNLPEGTPLSWILQIIKSQYAYSLSK